MNDIRVRTDDPPVSRVQRLPAAPQAQSGGDPRQGVAALDGVTGRGHRAGITSTVPGWITSGSAPMTGRLVSYSSCQPPRTSSAAAMPDSVSPGRTTYRAAAATGFAAAGACRGHVQGDLGSTTRHADARLGPGNGP